MKSESSARNQSETRAGVAESRNLQGQRETDAHNSVDRQVPMAGLYERQDWKHAVWLRKNRANIWKVAVSMAACLLLFWLCLPLLQRDDIRDARLAERNPVLDTLSDTEQDGFDQATDSSRPNPVSSLLLGENQMEKKEEEVVLPEPQTSASASQAAPSRQEASEDSVKTQTIPAQLRPRRVDTLPEIKLTPAEYRRLVTPMAPPKAYYAANLMERESHEGQKGISQEETMDSSLAVSATAVSVLSSDVAAEDVSVWAAEEESEPVQAVNRPVISTAAHRTAISFFMVDLLL